MQGEESVDVCVWLAVRGGGRFYCVYSVAVEEDWLAIMCGSGVGGATT